MASAGSTRRYGADPSTVRSLLFFLRRGCAAVGPAPGETPSRASPLGRVTVVTGLALFRFRQLRGRFVDRDLADQQLLAEAVEQVERLAGEGGVQQRLGR